MVTAWTQDNVDFRGEHYQVAFPSVRPRPYQKPHPPLARACINRESIMEMARIGRPILLRGRSTNSTAADIVLYRDTMAEAGFDEEAIERNSIRSGSGARSTWPKPTTRPWTSFCRPTWKRTQPSSLSGTLEPEGIPHVPPTAAHSERRLRRTPNPDAPENLVGSPQRVAEQLDEMRSLGIPEPHADQSRADVGGGHAALAEALGRTGDAEAPRWLAEPADSQTRTSRRGPTTFQERSTATHNRQGEA